MICECYHSAKILVLCCLRGVAAIILGYGKVNLRIMSISVLYTRVSSVDQKTDRQQVKEDDFDKVIEDKCSGAIPIFERPEGSSLKILIDRQLIKSISVWNFLFHEQTGIF